MSHQRAVKAMASGFFDDLVVPVEGMAKDGIPRADSSAEKLASLKPAFDRDERAGHDHRGQRLAAHRRRRPRSGSRTTRGFEACRTAPRASSPTGKSPRSTIFHEGLLMAPAYAIPRLLARNGLTYGAIDLWEIHEAFAAQVLCNVAALESESFLRDKVGCTRARQAAVGPLQPESAAAWPSATRSARRVRASSRRR
jgi:acetyl-CoA C-acetyltransferase